MARERARREKARPSASAEAHDRGLWLAALRTIDAHLREAPIAPRGSPPFANGESELGGAGARSATGGGHLEIDRARAMHDPLAALEQAFLLVREADRSMTLAEDILGALHRTRGGRWNDGDRMLFKEWHAARKESSAFYIDDALVLDLLADPTLRPLIIELLAAPGGEGIESNLRTLASHARARGQSHVIDGLAAELLTSCIDQGKLDLSDLGHAANVREAARILCARGVAAGFVEQYRKLHDVAHASAALSALWESPLRATEEMRTAVRLLAEQPQRTPVALVTWLKECLSGKLPLCQTGTFEAEEAPVKSRRGTPSRARSPSAPSGSPRARKAR